MTHATQSRTTLSAALLQSIALAAGTTALIVPVVANAAGTRAGTVIDNTATATFDQGGTPVTVNSNVESILVDELLDAVVDWSDASDVQTTPNATSQILAFELTNGGNGREAFTLSTISTLGGDQYDPTVTSIVIDDGDGVYEPGIDVVYVPGSNDPVLDPDQKVTVFVVATTPVGVTDGNRGGVQLIAAAKTGTGAPGTAFAGQGEGGGDAIVGTSGADGADDGYYQVTAATVTLLKTASVSDPFGGASAVPGAIVTYTIAATTAGSGSLPNLSINDAVPTGTTYVPGSITLGGTPITDAADADAGRYSSNAVSVALGTVAGGQTRTVTFRVTIN